MVSNLPTHHTSSIHSAQLDRRERRQVQGLEGFAAVEHVALQLRRDLAQTHIVAETAVTQTAMASVTATAASAAALRKAVPEVAEALGYLQTRHTLNVAQRTDDFAGER
jgi:hypothetical protein